MIDHDIHYRDYVVQLIGKEMELMNGPVAVWGAGIGLPYHSTKIDITSLLSSVWMSFLHQL